MQKEIGKFDVESSISVGDGVLWGIGLEWKYINMYIMDISVYWSVYIDIYICECMMMTIDISICSFVD